MAKTNLDPTRVLIISSVIIVVIAASLLLYSNYRFTTLSEDFNTQLIVQNRELLGAINSLESTVQADIMSLQTNVSSEMELIDSNVQNLRSDYLLEIGRLDMVIDEIEQQSNIRLDQLQEQVKDIQVESQDFTVIIDEVIESVVSVGTNVGQGSGVIIDDRGFIVTNFHVVEGASLIRILTSDDRVYDAQLIGFDDIVDVAVLFVDKDLPALPFGNSDDVQVGERVIALGNPAGLSFSVTEGIVSATGRQGPNGLDIYLQTDVPINPGNSGGPLVTINSEIVGLNNFKIGGFESLGFAIESDVVEEVVEEIIAGYYQLLEQQAE